MKREAKQAAARALLRMMDEGVDRLLIPESSEPETTALSNICDCDPEPPGNPVMELNDLCLKIRKIPPQYEVRRDDM